MAGTVRLCMLTARLSFIEGRDAGTEVDAVEELIEDACGG